MDQINLDRVSRKLAFLLRHSPEMISCDGGWARTEAVVSKLKEGCPWFTIETLERIVAEDQKGRYSFDTAKQRIRANQGHSVPGVIVDMDQREPPELLYHGTAERFMDSIMAEGLKPMSRLYVHLSPDAETAIKVGARHGKPVVLVVRSGEMAKDGYTFWLSANGVWQTKQVPRQYLESLRE